MAVLGGLRPYFQLQVNRDRSFVSAEILMRTAVGDIGAFVQMLEQEKLIAGLDMLAFKYCLAWHAQYGLPCASNFSGATLCSVEAVERVLETKAYPLDNIAIELTESQHLEAIAIENLEKLERCGFKLSLDDYGSEFNGINRLSALPFKEIKIDRFLSTQLEKEKTKAIVESTINLAHRLGCICVAEGVETEAQFLLLRDLGCDRFQGFYFHRPQRY